MTQPRTKTETIRRLRFLLQCALESVRFEKEHGPDDAKPYLSRLDNQITEQLKCKDTSQ